MESMVFDLTLLSATGLKDVNFLSPMDVYAELSIPGVPKSKQKTPVDKDSGPNPVWNYAIKSTVFKSAVQLNQLHLNIKLKSDRILGDRKIGDVHVPIKELLDNFADEKSEKRASYSVRLPNGKPKGTVDFAYKFEEKLTAPVEEPVMADLPGPAGLSYGCAPPPAYAYQQPQKPKRNGPIKALGLGARLLGCLLIGDNVSDVGEMASFDADELDF